MIEKIAVISEKSDSSYDYSDSSESSVDMSEDEEPASNRHSSRRVSNKHNSRLIYLMVPQNALNSNGSFVNSNLHHALL